MGGLVAVILSSIVYMRNAVGFTVTQRERHLVEALNNVLQFFAEMLKIRVRAVFETFRHVQRHWHVCRNSCQLRLQAVCIQHRHHVLDIT